MLVIIALLIIVAGCTGQLHRDILSELALSGGGGVRVYFDPHFGDGHGSSQPLGLIYGGCYMFINVTSDTFIAPQQDR